MGGGVCDFIEERGSTSCSWTAGFAGVWICENGGQILRLEVPLPQDVSGHGLAGLRGHVLRGPGRDGPRDQDPGRAAGRLLRPPGLYLHRPAHAQQLRAGLRHLLRGKEIHAA